MKAALRKEYCSPDKIIIENIDKPTPKDNELLIKIHATTVNRTDCANLTAKPFIMRFVLGFFKPRITTLGTDLAGEVVSMGKHVKSFKIGDRVFAFNDTGSASQAEFTIVQANNLFPIPDNISFEQAAASLEGAHYAYSTIRKVNIQGGQSILINGATGAIGSTKNIALIKSLGADKVYDYLNEDFATKNDKYDFIFDSVGKSTFGKCKPLLKDDGIYISSELGPYSQNVFYALCARVMRKKVIFPIPCTTQESIPFIINQLRKGTFKPVIDRTYSLNEISKAYDYVIQGEKTGNVVIKF